MLLHFKDCDRFCTSFTGPKDQSDETIAEIQHLEERYKKLVADARKQVEQKVSSVSEFLDGLTPLPSLMENREEFQQKIEKHFSVIHHADSIEDIFRRFSLHIWDYLNYHLLQYILKVYGDDEIKQNMQDYVSEVEKFKEATSLYTFWSIHPKRTCPEISATLRQQLKEVKSTHSKLTLQSTLAEVERYRRDLAQHYTLPEFTTIIVGIEPGSVTTVWLMSLSAVTVLQERIKEGDVNFLLTHGITKLRVDGKTVYSAGLLSFYSLRFALVPAWYIQV